MLSADAGEVRGFAYYTGTIFSIYAGGPGEAIGGGGRYDDLLSRFGLPMPAVGLGLDIDALAWALRASGRKIVENAGLVVVGADAELLKRLRGAGICAVAVADRAAGEAYARSWGFAEVVEAAEAAARVVRNAP